MSMRELSAKAWYSRTGFSTERGVSDELTYDRVEQRADEATQQQPCTRGRGDVVAFGTAEARGDGVADWGKATRGREERS
jgi:hypothetical protein